MRYVSIHEWPDWRDRPEPVQHNVYVHDMAMIASHDVACSVCMSAPAVLERDMTPGSDVPPTFQPCRSCQTEGWRTLKRGRLLRWWSGD